MQNASASGASVLPLELTSFIGRQRELAALRTLLEGARLVTLTGAGGSGKSRLARQLIPDVPGGGSVVWVELAPIADPELVAQVVLRTLDPQAEKGADAEGLLVDLLREDPPLLVLDNCEHVVEACARLADALLRACPELKILATSREALGVGGERAWLVPPLDVPDPGAMAAELAAVDSVRLFVERAQDVLATFELTEENAAAVADICVRLDGIPLAIELAAARVRLMTPEQIRARLSDAFALLTSGSRTALPRHRTLRAAMDWSHDLLPAEAQVVLRRLSVFRGGFTLDAAEAVAAGGDIGPGEVLDLVATLLDRSLLVMREQDGGARYRLLETMRQYAGQRLEAAGEAQGTRQAMTAFYLRFLAEQEPAFTTTSRRVAFGHVDPELDNIREVLEWTSAHDTGAHVALVGMMWWYWFGSRHWLEARRWIDGALATPEGAAPGLPRAAVLFAGGALSSLQAQVPAARSQLEECMELARQAGDPRLEAYALNYAGMSYAQVGDPRARELCARAEGWLRPNGDMYGLRLALLLRGMGEAAAGELAAARATMEEAVGIARQFGQDRELGIALQTLAGVTYAAGDVGRTEALLVESLSVLVRDWGYIFVARAVDFLAVTGAARDPAEAARRLGAGAALLEHVGARRFQLDQQRVDAATEQLRQRLGDAAFDDAYARGRRDRYRIVQAIVAGGAPPEPAVERAEQTAVRVAPPPTAMAQGAEMARAPSAAPAQGNGAVAEVRAREGTAPWAGVQTDLAVRLFGSLEVSVRGEPVTGWAYAKPKELLAFLLAHRRGRTRPEIGAAIWPDATPAQLRNSFHVTLHHLRKALGHADWVVIENERYRLSPTLRVWSDVAEFEELVRTPADAADAGRLRQALDLYRDHYLAGESASRWRDDEQDRLRGLMTEAGLRLGELLEGEGATDAAVAVYEALIGMEPLQEEAHRRLIRYWAAAGDRVRAARQYERLAARLEGDLGLEPDPETAALYRSLKVAAQGNPTP
jgi:predicted ATPase/DNA-binding SARP family transcriptional activator